MTRVKPGSDGSRALIFSAYNAYNNLNPSSPWPRPKRTGRIIREYGLFPSFPPSHGASTSDIPLRTSTILVAVAATLSLLPSCEKLQNGVVNEIEFPEHEPRLAVNMFVSPGDSVVYATVYQSAGVTDSVGS